MGPSPLPISGVFNGANVGLSGGHIGGGVMAVTFRRRRLSSFVQVAYRLPTTTPSRKDMLSY